MTHSPHRRTLLVATAVMPIALARSPRAWADSSASATSASLGAFTELAALEASAGGRLGVFALDTARGATIAHRADERFAFCSTFKTVLAGAILKRAERDGALLQRRVSYARGDLARYSPVTERHVGAGMTIAQLCGAALQYSDNTAANLLIGELGGPGAVTAFARSIGDRAFRLDRRETALNTALPGDVRDTTTPAAMARTLQRLVLGDALDDARRALLRDWLRGNTTGDKRIRAAVPAGSQVGDKTGTGDYGTTNDIGVIWPPSRAPIVLVVYYTQREPDAKPRDDVIAHATRIVMGALR